MMASPLEYDCLVIGAGPAGSVAASGMSKNGLTTLMIEKRAEIGSPVRCGEGISKSVLDIVGLRPDRSFVAAEMEGARIYSPSGHELVLGPELAGPEVGYVIRRDAFDRELARKAAVDGADILVLCEALDLRREEGRALVRCSRMGEPLEIRANVVVAADGFESQVARWGGLDPSLAPRDIDTCVQYQMVGVESRGSYCDFYLGNRIAPGGYVWCFPKGNGLFNVGIGINGSMMDGPGAAKRYLDRFISSRKEFERARTVEINAGGVSVSLPMERTVSDNLLVAGDAARMIDPLTGGGIYNACISGIEAAKAAAEAHRLGSFSEKSLAGYETAWRERMEGSLVRNYIAKEKLLSLSDETLDRVINAISGFDMRDISTSELIRAVRETYPDLARELMS